ncbi:MAG: hypothetical protein WBA09_22340 [Candidatus Acidiferrum sp.]
MSVEFTFLVINAEAIKFAFAGLAENIKDFRPHIWPQVRNRAIKPWLRAQFSQEGHGEHGKWAPLSEKYAVRKEMKWGFKPILEASGKLKRSLLAASNKGVMTARTFEYGTDVAYGLYQQTGTRRGLPARRIFDPEVSDGRGSLKQLIRSAVGLGVSNQARALGFAVRGDEVSSGEAKSIGKSILSQAFSVSEGI